MWTFSRTIKALERDVFKRLKLLERQYSIKGLIDAEGSMVPLFSKAVCYF